MQRNSNMGTARFYDWSEQDNNKEGYVSVSRLYREMAGGSKFSLARSQSERVRQRPAGGGWTGPGVKARMSPGRMFLRDKGMLTKGEREIIEGIYKNRGDLHRDPAATKSDYIVRSHHDAWLVGKHYNAANKPSTEILRHLVPSGRGLTNVIDPSSHSTESPRTCSSEGLSEGHGSSCMNCIMCLWEQQLKQQQQPLSTFQKQGKVSLSPLAGSGGLRSLSIHDKVIGKAEQAPAAPPSSPDGVSSRCFLTPSPPSTHVIPHLDTRHTIPPPDSQQHWDFLATRDDTAEGAELGKSLEDREAACHRQPRQGLEDSKRKLHVKVYLPKVIPEPVEDDLKTYLLQDRPALTRERPLGHNGLKSRHREQNKQRNPDDNKSNVLTEITEHQKKSKKLQERHCYSGNKNNRTEYFAPRVEGDADSSEQKTPVMNRKVYILTAEMEDWQLYDE